MNLLNRISYYSISNSVITDRCHQKKDTVKTDDDYLSMSINGIGDDIYTLVQSMYLLAKRMRDLLQDYNQKQQSHGWQIRILAINKKINSIEETKGASLWKGTGSIIGGIAGVLLGFGIKSSAFASPASQIIDSAFGINSAVIDADANINKQRADLVEVNANNYLQSLDSVSAKSTEIMDRLFEFTRSMIALKAQIMNAVRI